MAHELEFVNGVAQMAYAGDTPWHGLGQEMSAGATLDDWRLAAGMDWELKRADVEFRVQGIRHGLTAEPDAPGSQSSQSWRFARRQVLYRSDTHEGLGVVSSRYREVPPRQVMDFFDRFLDRQGFAMSAAGTLRKGAVLWATAQTGHGGVIKDDDEVKQYVLLSTSCDGTSSTEVRLTNVRVVCANTLAMAKAPSEPDFLPFAIVVVMSKIAIGPSGTARPKPAQKPSVRMFMAKPQIASRAAASAPGSLNTKPKSRVFRAQSGRRQRGP